MAGLIEARLAARGIVLPEPRRPEGNYLPAKRAGDLLFLAGNDPFEADGSLPRGKVGLAFGLDEAYRQARSVGLALVAAMRLALGDLDRVAAVVSVLGMVNAAPGFAAHERVIDGCSDLLVEIFGARGRHVRTAIGVTSLYCDMPVEIEAIVALGAPGRSRFSGAAPAARRRAGAAGASLRSRAARARAGAG